MCGRAYSPRQLWMWPNARISVMGGVQAASTLLTVRMNADEEKHKLALDPDQQAAFKQPILDKYETEGNPYYSTARIWDDGIIDPLDTRRVLAIGLRAARYKAPQPTKFGVFRM
jgi:acetyl-CoA carboxylase carboxyltransferase component